ncbi:TPA: alpha/beta fold hydrolase [Citrobacter freundii]
MPGLLSALSDETINFHIVNYAGSAGFGKQYRTAADGCTLSGSLPPLINWINETLNGTHLILCGGSFGGTMALELLGKQNRLDAHISGIVLINPLLDLNFHINRVLDEGGDMTFFNRKFSEEDCRFISPDRFIQIVNESDTRIQFILGRHDEVLTIRPALSLLRLIRDNISVHLHIDDGGHSTLKNFTERESMIISFIQGLLA